MEMNHERLIAFLRNPPKRISADAVKRRKKRGMRHCPGNRKSEMFRQQKGRCKYCRVPMTWDYSLTGVTVDHVVPLSRGGRNRRDNIVLACRKCNQAKADIEVATFRALVEAGLEERKESAAAALKRGWR
jgi:5-methylcytosine-specific restriction endonuclease McrA